MCRNDRNGRNDALPAPRPLRLHTPPRAKEQLPRTRPWKFSQWFGRALGDAGLWPRSPDPGRSHRKVGAASLATQMCQFDLYTRIWSLHLLAWLPHEAPLFLKRILFQGVTSETSVMYHTLPKGENWFMFDAHAFRLLESFSLSCHSTYQR